MTSPDTLTPSMWLRHANGAQLISANTAKEIVRLIVAEEHGHDELERNEPLSVRDEGPSWLVIGPASNPLRASDPQSPSWSGRVQVRISKFDGQILDYSYALIED